MGYRTAQCHLISFSVLCLLLCCCFPAAATIGICFFAGYLVHFEWQGVFISSISSLSLPIDLFFQASNGQAWHLYHLPAKPNDPQTYWTKIHPNYCVENSWTEDTSVILPSFF
jgi:hypothetical protein